MADQNENVSKDPIDSGKEGGDDVGLRDQLELAFEKTEKESKDGLQEEGKGRQEGKVVPPAAKEPSATAKPSPDAKVAEAAPKKEIVEPSAPSGTKQPPKATEAAPKEQGAPKEFSRAPGSWKPAVREKWTEVPKEVQSEILRREAEVTRGLNESAQARKFQEEFSRVVSPYQNIIAVEGNNPLKFVNDLMVTAQTLYHGSPQQKVNVVASFIKNFGVDIASLDQVLAGQGVQPQQQSQQFDVNLIRQEINQALAPILRGQQQNQQLMGQQVNDEVANFASNPENEFFEDVRDTMADLLEMAARKGQTMDLQTAYKRATMMHDDIAEVIRQRSLQSQAAELSSAAAAAKSKAVSVVGYPVKGNAGDSRPETLRGAIESAFEQAASQ